MDNRRKLVIALGAAALAAPLASFAQTPARIGRIGFLSPYQAKDDPQFAAFKQQMRDLGHVEGKTVTIDYLSAEGKYDRLPTVGGDKNVPEKGGLMGYGANRLDLTRRAAVLVDKILKGAKPAELPVEQPTKFEFVVNLKTAKALGIKIPDSILVQTTRVIE